MRRRSPLFLALMAFPLIGVAASHASFFTPSSQARTGQVVVSSIPQGAASNARMTLTTGDRAGRLPAGAALRASSAATMVGPRVFARTSTPELVLVHQVPRGTADLPLAVLMVFFATGGIFLLRTIARMMI